MAFICLLGNISVLNQGYLLFQCVLFRCASHNNCCLFPHLLLTLSPPSFHAHYHLIKGKGRYFHLSSQFEHTNTQQTHSCLDKRWGWQEQDPGYQNSQRQPWSQTCNEGRIWDGSFLTGSFPALAVTLMQGIQLGHPEVWPSAPNYPSMAFITILFL